MEKTIQKNTQNMPLKKFRAGAICATVWNNSAQKDGKPVEFKSVTFERSYLDSKSGLWKKTNTLKIHDLPKASTVLNKAYEYLVLSEQSDSNLIEEIAL